jgi:predicted protein tyrosine phosphatase
VVAKLLRTIWNHLATALERWFGPQPVRPKPLQVDWVIPGKLAVGKFPQAKDIDLLLSHNIQLILTLSYPQECSLPPELRKRFRHGYISMPDSRHRQPIQPAQLLRAAEVIHRALSSGLSVYVHCLAGMERSPLVCVAYLCLHRKMPIGEALRWVKQVHPSSMPTPAQLQVLEYCLHKQQELTQS